MDVAIIHLLGMQCNADQAGKFHFGFLLLLLEQCLLELGSGWKCYKLASFKLVGHDHDQHCFDAGKLF